MPGNKGQGREQCEVAKFELQKRVQSGSSKLAALESDIRS